MWEETWSVPGIERRPLWLEQSKQVGSIHSEKGRGQVCLGLVGNDKNFPFYSKGEDFKLESHMI